MRKFVLSLSLAFTTALLFAGLVRAGDDATVGGAPTDQLANSPASTGGHILPNGWKVTPVGTATQLPGDMPTQMILTPDGKYLLTATGGYTEHGISAIDVATQQIVDHQKVPSTFAGLCIDASGTHVLLSPGGGHAQGTLYSFSFHDGQLKPQPGPNVAGIPSKGAFIGGLASGRDGATYIASIEENKVYKLSGDGKDAISTKVGYRPCAMALSPEGDTLAVANWGDKSVSLLSAADLKLISKVTVGSHPAAVAWSTDGRLFVANAGGNTVSAINKKTAAVIENIRTSLDFQVPVGSTPDALAVDSVGKRLYIANADNNDVAVVDISDPDESKVLGFIPTGWYPCALAVSADGKMIFIGTGKALDKFTGNDAGPVKTTAEGRTKFYIGNLLRGHVSFVAAPDEKTLAGYTRQVLANTPVPRAADQLAKDQTNVLENAFGKIKHVVYVIKENRTYDQVFGDMPQGNGDPGICMFGQKITPNHHAIASEWVLLDNLYCNGEVSADGHAWCDAAYANDYTERSWTNTYSKRTGVEADDRLENQPAGYIWDNAIAHHLSFLSYGEGGNAKASPEAAPDADDKSLASVPFSRKWQAGAWKMGAGQRDYQRMQVFIDDLHAAESTGDWPALTVMSLPEDHTAARRVGKNTPDACVASNDLAVGMMVEAITHSKFWPETAIFIIEDDAQNGQDHVDAHRTVGLVISPYTRRGVVDHTMYTTSSMVRTIELMLHLPPMTQYDAAATPMFASFTSTPDLRPFNQEKAEINLAAVNPKRNAGAAASAMLDLSDLDRADPDQFNAILWDWFKPGTEMPAPVRSMIFVE
jgi:YVTN family beta-propeller protein